jgi:hypothetical protein
VTGRARADGAPPGAVPPSGRYWDPLDATPTRNAPDVRYIPTQLLMDESPAFEARIMPSMGAALLVKRASIAPF